MGKKNRFIPWDGPYLCTSVESLQRGNIYMDNAMKRKQLTLGIDKCSVLVFDKKSRIGVVREAINKEKKSDTFQSTIEGQGKRWIFRGHSSWRWSE